MMDDLFAHVTGNMGVCCFFFSVFFNPLVTEWQVVRGMLSLEAPGAWFDICCVPTSPPPVPPHSPLCPSEVWFPYPIAIFFTPPGPALPWGPFLASSRSSPLFPRPSEPYTPASPSEGFCTPRFCHQLCSPALYSSLCNGRSES